MSSEDLSSSSMIELSESERSSDESHNSEQEEKEMEVFKYSKTRLFLIISLLVTGILIFVFIGIIVIISYSLLKENEEGIHETLQRGKFHRYPFLHTKNGKVIYSGKLSLPNEIERPFINLMSRNQSDVMLIFGWGKKKYIRNFEVVFNLYCCPNEVFDGFDFKDECRLIRSNIYVSMPGDSEEDIRRDLIYRVTENPEVQHCNPDEVVFDEILEMAESEPFYDCKGYCKSNSFRSFLKRNPTLTQDVRKVVFVSFGELATDEDLEKNFLRPMFKEESVRCERYFMEGKFEAKEGLSRKDVNDAFKDVLDSFCSDHKYLGSSLLEGKKYYGVCAASGKYDCKEHDMSLYETLSVGEIPSDGNEIGNEDNMTPIDIEEEREKWEKEEREREKEKEKEKGENI